MQPESGRLIGYPGFTRCLVEAVAKRLTLIVADAPRGQGPSIRVLGHYSRVETSDGSQDEPSKTQDTEENVQPEPLRPEKRTAPEERQVRVTRRFPAV